MNRAKGLSSFLQSQRPAASETVDRPELLSRQDAAVLEVLRVGGMIPLSELPRATSLAPAMLAQSVERLRKRGAIEIYESEDADGMKFASITSRGLAIPA